MFNGKKQTFFANTKFTERLGQASRSRRLCELALGNLNFKVLPRLVLPDQLAYFFVSLSISILKKQSACFSHMFKMSNEGEHLG